MTLCYSHRQYHVHSELLKSRRWWPNSRRQCTVIIIGDTLALTAEISRAINWLCSDNAMRTASAKSARCCLYRLNRSFTLSSRHLRITLFSSVLAKYSEMDWMEEEFAEFHAVNVHIGLSFIRSVMYGRRWLGHEQQHESLLSSTFCNRRPTGFMSCGWTTKSPSNGPTTWNKWLT